MLKDECGKYSRSTASDNVPFMFQDEQVDRRAGTLHICGVPASVREPDDAASSETLALTSHPEIHTVRSSSFSLTYYLREHFPSNKLK